MNLSKLSNNKASQHPDIPTKVIKSNSGGFKDFLYLFCQLQIKNRQK